MFIVDFLLSVSVAVALCVLALVAVNLFGIKTMPEMDSGMEPRLPRGSMVFVQKAGMDDLEVDDVISIIDESGNANTKRIIEINREEKLFAVKSDKSDNIDTNLVHYDSIEGVMMFYAPFLGYAQKFLTTMNGIIVSASAVVLLIIIRILISKLFKDKTKVYYVPLDQREENEKADEEYVDIQSLASNGDKDSKE